MASSPNEEDRRLFAEELKAARAQRGWSSEEVANRIGFSQSTVKNIESGQRAPTPEQARLLDGAFETSGTFQRLERRIRGIPFSAGFRPYAPHEQEAHTLKTVQHSIFPGLFQTEDYGRTLLESHPETSPDVVQERLDARLARQAILFRKNPLPPRIWAVLDEQLLYRATGGAKVMQGQMEHLLELAQMPRIHIQVIPKEVTHTGLMGAFVIAETDHPTDIVFLETAFEGQVVEDSDMAESMTLVFDTLRAEALSCGASLVKIEEAVRLWQQRSEA